VVVEEKHQIEIRWAAGDARSCGSHIDVVDAEGGEAGGGESGRV
jgi:hypothetical protein